MKFEFEIETKIEIGEGNEKKFSLSGIKDKAKKIAENATSKSNEAMAKIITNVSEACDDALCTIADMAQATVDAIDEYFEDSLKDEKTFSEKLSEFETEENLTLGELLDSLDVYTGEETVSDTVNAFFENIEYPAKRVSHDAFESIIGMNKITYEAVAEKISEMYICISEEEIIADLIKDFNEWLETHPKVSEICSKPNMRYLMMYFAKKAKEAEETFEE